MDTETKYMFLVIIIIVCVAISGSYFLHQYNVNNTKDLEKTGVLIDVVLDLENSPERVYLYFEDGSFICFDRVIHSVYAEVIQHKGKSVTLNYISHAILLDNEFVSIEKSGGN